MLSHPRPGISDALVDFGGLPIPQSCWDFPREVAGFVPGTKHGPSREIHFKG